MNASKAKLFALLHSSYCLARFSLNSSLSKFVLVLQGTTSERAHLTAGSPPPPSSQSKLCQCVCLSLRLLVFFLITFFIIHNYSSICVYVSDLHLFHWVRDSRRGRNQCYPQILSLGGAWPTAGTEEILVERMYWKGLEEGPWAEVFGTGRE